MAGAKKVWRDTVFSIDGLRISIGANSVALNLSRVEVDSEMFEDMGDASEKGSYKQSLEISGAHSQAEHDLLVAMSVPTSPPVPFISFRDSSAASLAAGGPAGPVVAQGTPCLFMDAKVFGVESTRAKNALVSYKAKLRSGGSYLFVGKVLYTNVGAAALTTAGGVVVTVPVLVGALGAGQLLAVAVAAVDPPGVPGTTPSCAVRLLHDAAVGFTTPISAHTFTPFTKPGGQMFTLDGDTNPLAGETYWALEFTPSGVGGQWTFMAGIDLITKS